MTDPTIPIGHPVRPSAYTGAVRTGAFPEGHRERVWESRVGEIPLRTPKVRERLADHAP